MEIFRFLKIIQRVIIFIVVCGFVPLAFYVFLTHPLNIHPLTEQTYEILYKQIKSGFIIDLRGLPNTKKNCTFQQAALYNQYCFQYCLIGKTCEIIDISLNCNIGSFNYIANGKKYCASQEIKNQILNDTYTFIELKYNPLLAPLFSLQKSQQNKYQHVEYFFNGWVGAQSSTGKQWFSPCENIVNSIGPNLTRTKLQSQGYIMTLRYLFYTLIPIYAITFLSTVIEMFTKYDCKRLMQISLVNASILSLSIIVIGIVFDVQCTSKQNDLHFLADNCVIATTQQGMVSKYNLSIDMANGLNTGFTIAIGIIGVLQMFLIIALGIVGMIEMKMNKLKKEDYSSGYQLYTV